MRLQERWAALPEPFEGWRVIEQPVSLSPVPPSLFADFNEIDGDLRSSWQDDDEKPNQGGAINWISGTMELFCSPIVPWFYEGIDMPDDVKLIEESFTVLHIHEADANRILRYSDCELRDLARSLAQKDHWEFVRDSLNRGRLKQTEVRAQWNAVHGHPPRGAKPKSRIA